MPPYTYDYGSNIVYQNNNVYVGGQDAGTGRDLRSAGDDDRRDRRNGQRAGRPTWTSLGVFALVQGEEKTSNNLFQLAVNKDGVIRGNYYDGVMDTTTPIYGSVDKKTQRAAWTIGKKKDRVFEAGLYNLTQPRSARAGALWQRQDAAVAAGPNGTTAANETRSVANWLSRPRT